MLESSTAQPTRKTCSVLIIAADPNIESLLGQLVAFAGHRPMFDVTAGAAGESVRLCRPDITLLDTALGAAVVRACLSAVDEVGSRVVLISSTASTSELAADARRHGCLYFPLPGGPKPLARILERALSKAPDRGVPVLSQRRMARPTAAVHPALCAALSIVARTRARLLGANHHPPRMPSHGDALEDEVARSRMALRAAVIDYARYLMAEERCMADALSIVNEAVAECATAVGAEPAIPGLLLDAEQWTRETYLAA